jgi:hypothetical protein
MTVSGRAPLQASTERSCAAVANSGALALLR